MEYLKFYFQDHFIFKSIANDERYHLVTLIIVAASSLLTLGAEGSKFFVILSGFLLVYISGIIAPSITHDSLVLNLHLLRAGYAFHVLATLGIGLLASKWLTNDRAADNTIFGPALFMAGCASDWLTPLTLAVILARDSVREPVNYQLNKYRRVAVAAMAVFVLAVNIRVARVSHLEIAELNSNLLEWQAIGTWAQANTNKASLFLLPWDVEAPFEAFSKRRSWVDWKRGAAVMWSPSYHHTWQTRILQVKALQNIDAAFEYAKLNTIDYIVVKRSDPRNNTEKPLIFGTHSFAVYRASIVPVLPAAFDHRDAAGGH